MKDGGGRPQEVIVGGQINNELCCDLDKWLSFGSVEYWRTCCGYSALFKVFKPHSILEIIERGIFSAWGTLVAQKVKLTKAIISQKRISCSCIYSYVYYPFYLNKGPKPRIFKLLSSISSTALQEHPKRLYCIIFGMFPGQFSLQLLLCEPWVFSY